MIVYILFAETLHEKDMLTSDTPFLEGENLWRNIGLHYDSEYNDDASYLASDHLCIRVYSSKSCTWCKCICIYMYRDIKKNNLDCKQMQLCLNQEIINLKVT